MRRKPTRTIREEERPTLLLMAAGAVAGAAAGLYLGHRYRSMDAFLADARKRLGYLQELWRDAALDADDRVRLRSEVEDDLDEDGDYDELDEVDEDDEDEVDEGPYRATEAFDEVDEYEDEDDDETEDLEAEEEYEFDDELEDDLAAAASDNGATEISRRREDVARRLEERVLRELRDEPKLADRAIEIAVVGDGVVELTGAVQTIEEVSRAAAIARSVRGVSMVLNRIEVRAGGHIDTASVARDPAADPDAGPAARD